MIGAFPAFIFIFNMKSSSISFAKHIALHYFRLVLTPSNYFLKLPLLLLFILSLFQTAVSMIFFLALSLSVSFSQPAAYYSLSCHSFLQDSSPVLIAVFIFCQAVFVLNRTACSLHIHSGLQDACEHFAPYIETYLSTP